MRITSYSSTCLLAVLACSAAWSAEPPTPAQEQELHGALADGISGQDFKLIDLSLKGFSAGAVQGEKLAKHIAEARVDAAMALLQPSQAGAVEAWTLAAQAKAGDKAALDGLRTAARTAFDTSKRPTTKEEARAFQVRQHTGLVALECLANLKDASVTEVIRSWMAVAPAAMPDFKLSQSDPVAYAFALGNCNATRMIPNQVLAAEKALSGSAWPGKLQAVITDKAFPLASRAALFSYGMGMIRFDDKVAADAAKAYDALSLSLAGEIDGQTPSLTVQQLLVTSYRIADHDQKLAFLKRLDEKVTDTNLKKQVAAYLKGAAAQRDQNAGSNAQRNSPGAAVAPPREGGGEF